ncbi:MAG: low-specificity L-threonine aldolase [Lentisphaeria bacterium]|nr:low-specificity L-threonine aldolase [Candidatus Neomarinimicrobiota bacterium]MCF7842256.1 low-specificity L-threonine aldolase [Lentisphaeria bacterium]
MTAKQWIDLRSDTVTAPTPEMREAIFRAPVGDDVYGEDPSINALEQKVAELMGKEAALYVPSGTMSNQVALKALTVPGDEVICDYNCHVFNYESGAASALSGAQLHPLQGERGILTAEQVSNAIRPMNDHFATSRVVALENTHNRAGGVIYPLERIREVHQVVQKHGLKFHLDGARLMNAVVATGIPAREWAAPFDTVSLCLSKGLGAPVGSVLSGSREIITKAHRFRKMFGGGMRQAGLLAAAGLYALEHHVERLAEDHRRARALGETLAGLGYLADDLEWVHTNMVFIKIENAPEFSDRLKGEGILANATSPIKLRMVTHLNFDDNQLDQTVSVLKKLLKR